MSSLTFDLTKPTQALSFVLKKNNVDVIVPSQVHLAFDVSWSFDDEHCAGYTQQLLNRFVPFSLLFDKNRTLDSYVFGDRCEKIDDINEFNFSNYVQKHIQKSSCYKGGTNYLPIFKLLVKSTNNVAEPQIEVKPVTPPEPLGFFARLFGKSRPVEYPTPIETPVVTKEVVEDEKHLVFFVTDGEASDQDAAKEFLDNTLKTVSNPYFVFISIGKSDFTFFKKNYLNTSYSNYFNLTPDELKDLDSLSDEALYEKVISPSLAEWMNK